MVTDREGLSIGTLIFYLPALFIASFVAYKHGFGRQAGWFFLILLALARIIGSICEIASVSSPSRGVITAFVILSSVGLSPLILAMLGLLKRVQEGMANGPSVPPAVFNFLTLAPIAGLVLAIIGGTDLASTDPSNVAPGHTLTRAAIIIFLVVFIILSMITIFTFFFLRSISPGEHRILYAVALSIPFLLVRLIYSLLANFDSGTTFSLSAGNVVVQAFMATIEEFVVVALYLAAGILAPKIARADVQPGTRTAASYERYSPAAAPGG
ncbi:hypothetical protein MMC30_007514 [Trapelia coarctata]|nr:hypothetical protein [Trapelia coarctata]